MKIFIVLLSIFALCTTARADSGVGSNATDTLGEAPVESEAELTMGTAVSIRNQFEEDIRPKDYRLRAPC
jgi:hypothetical protein